MLSVFWNHNKYITFQTRNEKEEFVLYVTNRNKYLTSAAPRIEGTSNLDIYDNR